jgi:hypothetical protein
MHQQDIQGAASMNKIETVRNGRETSETRDGMTIDWDVPITMDDGLVLRADVYRPIKQGSYPAIVSYGPYAKWLAFQDGYSTAWDIMVSEHPDVAAGSTNKYQSWEVVDPEKWVPDGYVCVRVDSRGAGRSPGYIDPFSPRETKISTIASNGQPRSLGATERSGSRGFPTTRSINGRSPGSSRFIFRRSAFGKAPEIGIATRTTRAGSSRRFRQTGTTCR